MFSTDREKRAKSFLAWSQQFSVSLRLKALVKVVRSKTREIFKNSVAPQNNASPVSDLEWFFSTPALIFYFSLMFVHLGALYYQPLMDYLRTLPSLQLSLQSPQWKGGSVWTQELPLLNTLEFPETFFVFDPWKEALSEQVKQNPWIKDAVVQYQFPKNIQVIAQVRKPCLWITQNGQRYLVDREGVRLPLISNFSESLLTLEGIMTPAPEIGSVWNDSVLKEACDFAVFLKKHLGDWLLLEKIQWKEEEFYLLTPHQTQIRWGVAPQSSRVHGDPKTHLEILRQFCRTYPQLQGVLLADIRFEEESFVCLP